MKDKYITIVKSLREFKQIIRLMFPCNRNECILLLSLLFFYVAAYLSIALNSSFLDYDGIYNGRYLPDIHLSFDSLRFFHTGDAGGGLHPLIRLIIYPLIYIGKLLTYLFSNYKAKTVFILFITSYCVAMSSVNICRYLLHILNINKLVSLLLVAIFALFSTSITLSCTLESYTFSLFFLSLLTYYYSLKIKNDQQSSFTVDLFFLVGAGGITVSNISRGLIGILFTQKKFKKGIIRGVYCSLFFLIIISVSYIIIVGDVLSNFGLMIKSYDLYSQNSVALGIMGTTYKTIESFFIDPILSQNIQIKDYYISSMDIKRIVHDVSDNYSFSRLFIYWDRYLFSFLFYSLILLSIWLNRKDKLFLFLIALWSVDIVLHLVLQFGLFDGYSMYAGHWVFLFPLYLGFLYKKITAKQQSILCGAFILLFIFIAINNLTKLYSFIQIIHEYFNLL